MSMLYKVKSMLASEVFVFGDRCVLYETDALKGYTTDLTVLIASCMSVGAELNFV